jgi:hypothetical protein
MATFSSQAAIAGLNHQACELSVRMRVLSSAMWWCYLIAQMCIPHCHEPCDDGCA